MPLPLATLFCQISLKTYVPERYTGKELVVYTDIVVGV